MSASRCGLRTWRCRLGGGPETLGLLLCEEDVEPGGDDDRQWLTFWLIALLLTFTEGFYDLLLSRLPIYYELKLSFLIWLIFRKVCASFRELRSPYDLPSVPTQRPSGGAPLPPLVRPNLAH